MILIADSGSTKTDWAAVEKGAAVCRFRTGGYNPNFISKEGMVADFRANAPEGFEYEQVTEVYFYGAGVSDLMKPQMNDALGTLFTRAERIESDSDLIASAKALLGDSRGLAAILGTGSNSCLYDGRKVEMKVDALGYILGDEGSGSYIGKKLIADYLRQNMPENARRLFAPVIGKTRDEIIRRIYTQPAPNRYCAGFARFVGENLDADPYFHRLVASAFEDFFRNVITHYPDYRQYPFNAVGSVAFHFRPVLEEVAERFGMRTGVLIEAPMDRLAAYYASARH